MLVPTLIAMMAAGLVLTLEVLVALPTAVVAAAGIVAGTGLVVFLAAVWLHARRTGTGIVRAAWEAVRDTVRLAFDLF